MVVGVAQAPPESATPVGEPPSATLPGEPASAVTAASVAFVPWGGTPPSPGVAPFGLELLHDAMPTVTPRTSQRWPHRRSPGHFMADSVLWRRRSSYDLSMLKTRHANRVRGPVTCIRPPCGSICRRASDRTPR